MEGSVRSGGVLKKRNSSGCLVIKKKVGNENPGRGFGVKGNERKRGGFVDSCSGSDNGEESLELMRRNVNGARMHNGSMMYKRHELEGRRHGRDDVGIGISSERKRSRAEFDEFDGRRMTNEYYDNTFNMLAQSGNENVKEFGVSSSRRNLVVDKLRQSSYFDGSSCRRSKDFEYNGVRDNGLELAEDGMQMPISSLRLKYQEKGDKTIRFQGKNGVLKVMVNKKKTMDFPSHRKSYDSRDFKETNHSRWGDDRIRKDLSVQPPIYPVSELPDTRGLFGDKEKNVDKEKRERKLEKSKAKSLLNKGKKARDSEVEGDRTLLKLTPPDVQARSTEKGMKEEEERSPGPENFSSVKGKEGKAKRGGSTEKQILREKIRGMLLEAGWTIDYRPRRNRDYLDAVYVNPGGTAYWSIIKAYDALKKQLGEDNGKTEVDTTSSLFAPLSEDLINKLTRQTKRKAEDEMKRKRKEDGTTSVKRPTFREAADSSDCDDDSPKRKSGKVRVEDPSTSYKSKAIQGRTSKVIGRCTLLVRGSDKGENSDSDGYARYSGKRTVLAWLIDSEIVQLSEKVRYMNRKRNQIMLEGWITRDGIHCGCCSKILTVSKFEMHAASKLRQPFQNIFLESGTSLLQCQIVAWNNQEQSICRDFHTVHVDGDDPDDDTCGICADGGDLICCDSCPSTFHLICLEIEMLPKGDWHCPNCICKFCGHAGGENVVEENDSINHELSRCCFCGKKYHASCGKIAISSGAPFCELKCRELYDNLQKILGVKHELEAGFTWSLIQRADISDASQRGFAQRVECNSKLAVALSVMDECFYPIIDRRSGINIVQSVVYNCGSNFNRLNFHAFYSVILERGDEIVSAACIRFHGTRVAEMPFIGTREIYRRQGMCRRLFSAIENELCSLNIEQLIIPAISEHMSTWTTLFGFQKLDNVGRKEMKSMNVLVFPATDILQKQLVKPKISSVKVSESTKSRPQLSVLVKKSQKDSSTELCRPTGHGSGVRPKSQNNDKDDDDYGSDNMLYIERATAIKLEVENKRNEFPECLDPREMDHMGCSPEDVVGDECRNEVPWLHETAGNQSPSTSECSSSSFEVNLDCDMHPSNEHAAQKPQPCSPSDNDVTSNAEVDVPGCPADLSPIHEVDDDSLKRGSSLPVGTSHDNRRLAPTSTSSAVETTRTHNAGLDHNTVIKVKHD